MRVVHGCTIAVAQSRCTMCRPQRPQTQGCVIVLAKSFKQGCLKPAALSCHTMWQPKRLTRHDAKPTEQARRARMHDSSRTKSLHDAATQTTAIRQPRLATLLPAQQAGYYFWCGGGRTRTVRVRHGCLIK